MALTNLNIQVKEMAVGYGHYLAIGTDGSLYSWGLNDHGQLGHGDKVNRSSPTKVGTQKMENGRIVYPTTIEYKTDWTQVVCGDYHSVALDSQGAAYGFGLNTNTQAGVGFTIDNYHNGIGGRSSRGDILIPSAGFRTVPMYANTPNPGQSDTFFGPASLIKAAANYTVIIYAYPGDIPTRTSYIRGGTWVYGGNSFLFEHVDTGFKPGPTTEFRDLANLRGGSRFGESAKLLSIDKCEVGRNFIAATTGGSQIYCVGTMPNSMYGIYGNDFGTTQTNFWKALRRSDVSDIANPIDNTGYIDFAVGDDFILAIDSEYRLHGMTFATSNGTEIPSTSVGNFGVRILAPSATTNSPGVYHGMALLDSSRRWLNVSCGAKHAIISDVDGNIFSMGNNEYGQLGRNYGTTSDITTMGQLELPANATGFKIHACGPQASLIAKES